MCSEESYCPRCHKNKETDFVAQSAMQQICDEKQFVNAVVDLTLLKQYPKLFPSDKRLFCAKYDVMLKTLAMNEFLGRPVPNVIVVYIQQISPLLENPLIRILRKVLGLQDPLIEIRIFNEPPNKRFLLLRIFLEVVPPRPPLLNF